MTCDVCAVFKDLPPDNSYIRALMLHRKLIHRQAQSKSSDCQSCKDIEVAVDEDRQTLGQISISTLNAIRGHIKTLHG
jgi:hypothetical protein